MSATGIWLAMLAGGLLTYATRLSFIVLLGRTRPPAWLLRSLSYVPPAVLSAIIFPELLLPGGEPQLSLANERLLAGLIAAVVAYRTRSALLTIVVGMAALFGLRFLLALLG